MWLHYIEETNYKATIRRAVKICHVSVMFNDIVIEHLS